MWRVGGHSFSLAKLLFSPKWHSGICLVGLLWGWSQIPCVKMPSTHCRCSMTIFFLLILILRILSNKLSSFAVFGVFSSSVAPCGFRTSAVMSRLSLLPPWLCVPSFLSILLSSSTSSCLWLFLPTSTSTFSNSIPSHLVLLYWIPKTARGETHASQRKRKKHAV